MKLNIGDRVGNLSVLDKKTENNRIYYYCKCDCGNEKWMRYDTIKKDCGCSSKFKQKDIKGNKYGRLLAISPTTKRDNYNGSVIWNCVCDCGNTVEVAEHHLSKRDIRSCGCLSRENSSINMQKAIKGHLEKHIVEGTNLQVICSNKLQSNNKSGYRGVLWDSAREKWKASIAFKGKVYFLGRYSNKEDAINVRQEAEEKLYKPFIERLKSNKK